MTQDEKEIDWRIRVFDSLSYPTRVLLPDGTILAVNEVFLKSVNQSPETIIGRRCREVNAEHTPEQTFPCGDGEKCPLQKTLKYKTGQSVLLHTHDAKGASKWEDRVFSPILGDNGEVKYIIESFRDVTRVKMLETLYTDMRELIDKVVESSVSAIIAANRTGEIILANEAAEKLFGISREELVKANIEDFYPEGVAREIMKKLRDEGYGGRGKLPSSRINVVSKGGELVPVQMTAAIIYKEGEEEATAGIFNDLREKLDVEQKLRDAQTKIVQTEKMASLGRLAAGVAHEINNPLTSILLYGNMMREKLETDHPLSTNLDYVLEDAERCRDIVKNLLAYSRQSSSAKNVFALNRLITDSLNLLHDQRLFLNIEVVKELASDDILIRADHAQVCQVVINLIMNAIDAMEENGLLRLRTLLDKETGNALLEVSDNGTGIPVDNISKIFDPFFTTKAVGKGTGLGLSMAYGVMKDNKGRIFIKDTSSSGTTIALELPVFATSSGQQPGSIG
jgi:two-component system NtrC family sensor kinase